MYFFRIAALLLVLGAAGCGGARLAPPVGVTVPDPADFAASLRAASLPSSPEQITFGWALDERGSGVSGRGVVRHEPAERIRLDLFGPRGETYLIAALVGGEYRLPPEAANAVALPSPTLLWGALGILEPPAGATLSSATTAERSAELRFGGQEGQVFVFTFQQQPDERYLLVRVERAASQGVLETVSIERGPGGDIVRTRYRDWTAFRDLTLDVESTQRQTAPFPATIWRPDADSAR